jgi:hypothetical protein
VTIEQQKKFGAEIARWSEGRTTMDERGMFTGEEMTRERYRFYGRSSGARAGDLVGSCGMGSVADEPGAGVMSPTGEKRAAQGWRRHVVRDSR